MFHAAGAGGGEHLLGAASAIGIERFADIVHHGQIVFREELTHEVDLLDSNAVLSGNAPAEFNALRENFITSEHHAADLVLVAFVEEQNRMDIPVARMEHIDNTDTMSVSAFGDGGEDLREFRPRYHAVLGAITGAETTDRPERLLAAFPKQLAFFGCVGGANFAGIASVAEFDDLTCFAIDGDFQPIDFNQQHRTRVEWETEMEGVFQSGDDALIHHLQSGGNDAGSDDIADGERGIGDGFEDTEHRAIRNRVTREPDNDFRANAERAFAADEQASQIKRTGFIDDTADFGERAIGLDEFDTEHMIDRHTIFQRVRTAGVRRHVPADRARSLAGRVRCVVKTRARQMPREMHIHDARFHDGVPISQVDFENLVHPRESNHHATTNWQASAGQTRAGSTRDERYIVFVARLDDFHDLLARRRKDHNIRSFLLDDVAITFVDQQFRRIVEQTVFADDVAEPIKKRGRSGSGHDECLRKQS